MSGFILPGIRDVEVIKVLMLLLPAPLELLCFRVRCRFHTFGNFCFRYQLRIVISRFRVRFHFQSFSLKCFRFHKNLTASTAFSFRFHILVCNSCNWLSTRFHKLQVTLRLTWQCHLPARAAATAIGVARIFDWGGQTTYHMQ